MPAKFTKCVAEGGKVRTINLSKTKYEHICVLPEGQKGPRGGRTVSGEVKTKKTKK